MMLHPRYPDIPMKRTVASTAAKSYDIMGWFGPITLTVKILMQLLWQAGKDRPLESLVELSFITSQPIPWQHDTADLPIISHSLYALADAFTPGYGAVVYLWNNLQRIALVHYHRSSACHTFVSSPASVRKTSTSSSVQSYNKLHVSGTHPFCGSQRPA